MGDCICTIEYLLYNCEKPVITGHYRSLPVIEPQWQPKNEGGWAQSVIDLRPIGRIGIAALRRGVRFSSDGNDGMPASLYSATEAAIIRSV